MNQNDSNDRTKNLQVLKISPIKKTRPSLMLPRSATKSTVMASEISSPGTYFPQPSKKNKSLSSPNLNMRSLIYDELGVLENQIKDINLQIEKNINVLQEKQKKNLELNDNLQKIELKTMPTDISFSEEHGHWPSCHKTCVVF